MTSSWNNKTYFAPDECNKTGLYFQNWMVKIIFSSLTLIERFVPTLIWGKYLAHQNIMNQSFPKMQPKINIWNMVLIQVGSIWYVQNVNTSRLLKIEILEILDQSEHPNKLFGLHTCFCLKAVVIMFTRLQLIQNKILMAWCKTLLYPLLMHWRYWHV